MSFFLTAPTASRARSTPPLGLGRSPHKVYIVNGTLSARTRRSPAPRLAGAACAPGRLAGHIGRPAAVLLHYFVRQNFNLRAPKRLSMCCWRPVIACVQAAPGPTALAQFAARPGAGAERITAEVVELRSHTFAKTCCGSDLDAAPPQRAMLRRIGSLVLSACPSPTMTSALIESSWP